MAQEHNQGLQHLTCLKVRLDTLLETRIDCHRIVYTCNLPRFLQGVRKNARQCCTMHQKLW